MPKYDAEHYKKQNPDRGPPMLEGEHYFDKGYDSDNEYFSPKEFPEDHERGNAYMQHQNEIVKKDSVKLVRGKFTKIH